jgi:hypothetical protein
LTISASGVLSLSPTDSRSIVNTGLMNLIPNVEVSIHGVSLWLGAAERQVALSTKDVCVQVSDPSPALDSDIQVPHRRLDLLRDMLPEEHGIAVDDVGRRGVAQPLVHPRLRELIKQSSRFSELVRIPELPDEIRGTHEPCLEIKLFVVAPLRAREASELDHAGDAFCIQQV